MDSSTRESRIEIAFRKQVQSDRRVWGTFLLVQSEKLGVDLNIGESGVGSLVHEEQPNHLASVGKLGFTDNMAAYLNTEFMKKLRVYRGHDYDVLGFVVESITG